MIRWHGGVISVLSDLKQKTCGLTSIYNAAAN